MESFIQKLSQVLKKHVGRRILLLMSELGMAVSQVSMSPNFIFLLHRRTGHIRRTIYFWQAFLT
jgi:hypothetical protein